MSRYGNNARGINKMIADEQVMAANDYAMASYDWGPWGGPWGGYYFY